MRFVETAIVGAYVIELDELVDDRGFFARTFCADEFGAMGLNPKVVQTNTSYNLKRGTLRGMHFQRWPHEEAKLVRCVAGAIYDVVVDLREASETFEKWEAVELSARNRRMIFVPEGCAHGFQTLEDHTELHYQMSEFYRIESTAGFHWRNNPFDISWPLDNPIVSRNDQALPDYQSGKI